MLSFRVPFILASQSPRRRTLLSQIGVEFHVHPSDAEEVWDDTLSPDGAVERIALQKAEVIAPLYPEALTLGADTVVVLEGSVLGKPVDAEEAASMLLRLSGATHTVFSGIALIHPASGRLVTAHAATQVTFSSLSLDEIQRYVATGSPMDKAGSYGIQDDHGALFVERINGDFYNVVGLPLQRLYQTIRTTFEDLLVN